MEFKKQNKNPNNNNANLKQQMAIAIIVKIGTVITVIIVKNVLSLQVFSSVISGTVSPLNNLLIFLVCFTFCIDTMITVRSNS